MCPKLGASESVRSLQSLQSLPAGGDGLFMVVDERGVFREDNFQKAVAVLTDTAADGKGFGGPKAKKGDGGNKQGKGTGEKSDIFKIVKMIMDRNYDPVSRVLTDCRDSQICEVFDDMWEGMCSHLLVL